jgi:hypothetical protein
MPENLGAGDDPRKATAVPLPDAHGDNGPVRIGACIGAGPARATLRCYAALNDYLPAAWRQRDLPLDFDLPLSVGALVKALGIPADAVELVLLDGASARLETPIPEGGRISLYPVFEGMDVAPLVRLRDSSLRRPRFLCDSHLGKLGRRLRLLGFDALLARDLCTDAVAEDPGDDALVRCARAEQRILLTRDRALLARPELTHGLRIPEAPADTQLRNLIARLHLDAAAQPFTRCTCCNSPIEPADPAAIGQVPAGVRQRQHRFWHCPGCGRTYWEGSHHGRMRVLIDRVLSD